MDKINILLAVFLAILLGMLYQFSILFSKVNGTVSINELLIYAIIGFHGLVIILLGTIYIQQHCQKNDEKHISYKLYFYIAIISAIMSIFFMLSGGN